MSYTTKIKNEILDIEGLRSEVIAELSGFIRNNGEYSENTLKLTTENKKIMERLSTNINELYESKVEIETKENLNFSKNKLYVIKIKNHLFTILEDIGYFDKNQNYLNSPPDYVIGGNEEIRAYLRGVFLCQGSINDPKTSRYHMELLITKPEEAVFVQKLLNIFDLNAKILTRDKGYMIYIKEAEKISDYLKILGASNAVMYFENIRIYRDKKNQTNRLNNCEQANINKVVDAASQQVKQIEIIKKHMGLDLLDEKTKEALEYRLKYKEASLKELSEIISLETGKNITKSGLNHRFRKIKELAEKFEKL